MIIDAIIPRDITARILPSRTPARKRPLRRRIAHKVPLPKARTALKDMEKPEPVPNLVNGGQTEIVVVRLTAGHRVGQDEAPVERELRRRRARKREEALAEEALAVDVGLEVHVQAAVCAAAEVLLHAELVEALGPSVVDGVVGVDEVEGDVQWGVFSVHHG